MFVKGSTSLVKYLRARKNESKKKNSLSTRRYSYTISNLAPRPGDAGEYAYVNELAATLGYYKSIFLPLRRVMGQSTYLYSESLSFY